MRTFRNKTSQFSLTEIYLKKERVAAFLSTSQGVLSLLCQTDREGMLAVAVSHGYLPDDKSSLLKADVITGICP